MPIPRKAKRASRIGVYAMAMEWQLWTCRSAKHRVLLGTVLRSIDGSYVALPCRDAAGAFVPQVNGTTYKLARDARKHVLTHAGYAE